MSVFSHFPSLDIDSAGSASIAWTPIRSELRTWFRTQAPSLATAYEGAVILLQSVGFPGRIHFIAHAVRDIADRLVFVLDAELGEVSRVQYENEFDVIVKEWPNCDHLYRADPIPAVPDAVMVPNGVAKRIDQLVAAHRQRRTRPSQYKLLFDYLVRNDPSRFELNDRIVRDFKTTREWFMNRTHLQRDKQPVVDENELVMKFESFEKMLHSFVGNFFTGTQELDAILKQANQ